LGHRDNASWALAQTSTSATFEPSGNRLNAYPPSTYPKSFLILPKNRLKRLLKLKILFEIAVIGLLFLLIG
jgi:hypothetical protein